MEDELIENIANSIRRDIQDFITRDEETMEEVCYYDSRLKFLPRYEVNELIGFFERGADERGGDSFLRVVTYIVGEYKKRIIFDLRKRDIIMCVEPVFR